MTTRHLFLILVQGLVATTAGCLLAAQPTQPNILLIMTDEHSARVMGCAGDSVVRTPNLDSLARNGVLFNAFYCASPICIPSRQSFTTGKRVSHHNVWANTIGVPEGTPSLPRILNSAGYESFLDGKMHYKGGMSHGFQIIDEKTGLVRIGKDPNPTPENTGKEEAIGPRERLPVGQFKDQGSQVSAEFTPIGPADLDSHIDVHRRNSAIKFLRERNPSSKPFFLVVGLISPHYPLVAPPEYLARYKDKVPPPEIPSGYIDQLPLNYKHLRNDRKMENVPPELAKLGRESYYALVEWTDHQIGLMLDALRATPFGTNTIVIYTSDHGENLGEHGLWWKNCLYDSSARVPLIISWPERWKPGQVRAKSCDMLDLVQTIAQVAGAKTPSDWDGVSFLPYLDDASAPWRDMAICEYYAAYLASGMVMIRQGDWKYVYHTRADEKTGHERELYNMASDPKELRNLAGDPMQENRMRAMHAAMIKELGEDPEKAEQRFRAGASPKFPQGVVGLNNTPKSRSTKQESGRHE